MNPADERLVFSSSVEGLLKYGLAGRMTPELKDGLKELGINLDRPLLPAYPSSQWMSAVELVAKQIYPELPEAEAHFKLGESQVFGIMDTFLGKGLGAFARLAGPKRSLLRFPSTSKTSTNFSKMEARELGPNEVEITSHPYEGRPEYLLGCVSGAIIIAGGKDPKVRIISHDKKAERAVLAATWTD